MNSLPPFGALALKALTGLLIAWLRLDLCQRKSRPQSFVLFRRYRPEQAQKFPLDRRQIIRKQIGQRDAQGIGASLIRRQLCRLMPYFGAVDRRGVHPDHFRKGALA